MEAIGKLIFTQQDGPDQEFALGEGSVTLGRGATNEIVLHDPRVSRLHARIECAAAGCTLTDLGSANGTRVNGTRVERAILKPGDVITLGDSTLRYQPGNIESGSELTAIHRQADLDRTLAQTSIPVALTDTHSPHVVVHTGQRTWRVPLEQDAVTIGRAAENDIDLDSGQVSRHHARIERRGASFILKDLNSRNGTWIGAQRVTEYTLQNGDMIRIGPAQLVFKGAFDSEDLTLVDTPRSSAARIPVIFVPGLMGSELWAGNTLFYPNVRLMFSQPELFRLPETQHLEARALIGDMVVIPNLIKLDRYNRFGDFLQEALGYERGKDFFEFAYDWRQDVRQSAQQLAESIARWNLKPPILIAGHSLGCLVSRYYVERLGGRQMVGRLFMIGSAYHGVPRGLTGLIAGPNLLPFGILGERLRAVFATWPSFYQILPTLDCVVEQDGKHMDVFEDERWLPESQRPLLRNAHEFLGELGKRSSVPMVSVFGYGIKTMTGARVERDGGGKCHKLDLVIEPKGDDSVPETSAVLDGAEIHPVQQYHGSLYVDNDVKMRLKLELTRMARGQ